MKRPEGLDAAGAALWDLLTGEYEFSPAEYLLLAELAHTSDELGVLRAASEDAEALVIGSTGQLKVHPLFGELREHRRLYVRLIEQLALPGEEEQAGKSPAARKAQKAAQARWREKQGERRGSA